MGYAAASHGSSTPKAIVCSDEPQTPSPSHTLTFSLGNHASVLQVHEFLFVELGYLQVFSFNNNMQGLALVDVILFKHFMYVSLSFITCGEMGTTVLNLILQMRKRRHSDPERLA